MSGYVHPSRPGHSGISSTGSGDIEVRDDGVSIGSFTALNFIGADVTAIAGGVVANIYIPPQVYDSHYNTSDGGNGSQAVAESISRTTTRISTPNGGEGSPFQTNGWAGANEPTTTSSSVTLSTPGECSGFGGNATAVVTVYSADGTTVLDTYTTPSLTQNDTHTSASGDIVITITSYGADGLRFKANMSVAVNASDILTTAGFAGGRYNVKIVMNTDAATDGTGPYTYTQPSVFYDTNPTTPSCTSPTISETAGEVQTRFLSGLEYYTTGSQFTAGVSDIDQLNRNTAKTSDNLALSGSEYGLASLSQSPFGSGQAAFSGWTNDNNNDNASYSKADWAITQGSFRYTGTTGNITATPKDAWGSGGAQNSANASFLVDTYATSATDTFDSFDDESRRKESDYTTAWTSSDDLSAGEAMVYMGKLITPSQSLLSNSVLNTNWSTFSPNAAGQPTYTAIGVPVSYYRVMVDSAGTERSSMTITFTGTFISNAATDLANENLKIYIRRVASSGGGGSGINSDRLRLHGANYNFATFDDGATVAGSYIRESSSSGNTVNATFGGYPCIDGFYIQIEIANAGIKIDSFDVTFF